MMVAVSGLILFKINKIITIYKDAFPISQVILNNCDDNKNKINIKSNVFLSIKLVYKKNSKNNYMQSYYEKYLKYKAKYLNLRNNISQLGGEIKADKYSDKDFSWFEYADNKDVRNEVISELEVRLREHKEITPKQIQTYLSALDAKYVRNKLCDSKFKTCPGDLASAVVLAKKLIYELKVSPEVFSKYANNLYLYVHKQSGGSDPKPQIYLFKAEWCGHCKGFKPTWEKIQKELKGKYEFITLDSDQDKEQISQWGIKGFPTIIKKVNENAEEFVGPRDENSVKEFIEKK